MKKRYSEEEILRILREGEAGKPVADILRDNGIAAPLITGGRANMAGWN